MNLLLGIGNETNGDDAIGVYVARKFKCKGWISIDCATVPENYTGEIRRYNVEKIVIVDAADMKLKAGEIRRITKDKIAKASFSTHSIPLSLFINHLEKTMDAKIYLIGIQPKSLYGEMSEEVKKAGERLMDYIKNDRIEEIKMLE